MSLEAIRQLRAWFITLPKTPLGEMYGVYGEEGTRFRREA